MKPIKYATFIFLLVALSNYVSAQVDNPYNLVTDEEKNKGVKA